MNKYCNEYIDLIFKKYSFLNPTIIIYGSNIYNGSSSDLDVCLILNKTDKEVENRIIKDTIKFHKVKNLKVDEEIPHTNKLIYTYDEVMETIENNPFFKNGAYKINDIVKTKEFLSSKMMKQRLLLNILTTDHLIFGTYKKELLNLQDKAWDLIIDTVINYFKIENLSVETLLQHLYTNQYTGATGEMFLGYKKNYLQKEKYLRIQIEKTIERRGLKC